MYFCMQLKMDDHSAHLWGPEASAQLCDHGDQGVETSVRPDLKEDEPGAGECEGKRGQKSAASTEATLKSVQPVQITTGISGWWLTCWLEV